MVELGTSVVFDAQNLQVGKHVLIAGQLLKVDKIINEAVYFKAVTGTELWKYRWQKNKTFGIAAITVALVIVMFVALASHFGLEHLL